MLRFVVYGFGTTHDALAAEKALADAGIPVAAVPTPKSLGALCGIAVRTALEDAERTESVLSASGIAWTGRVEIEDRVPGDLSR
ncbi:MAG: DUF3343 domain-containing protein [Coriobacteriia bacterium]|nr:DUF3343 domain-containing protein [Coriobacteriia bacterium]